MKIDIQDLIDIDSLMKKGVKGTEIDALFNAFLVIKEDYKYPFIGIKLKTSEQLEYMITEANNVHIYCENSIFKLIAYYNNTELYPLSRSYYIETKKLLDAGKYRKKYELENIYGPHNYNEFLKQEGNFSERIINYVKEKKEKNKLITKLFLGREKNTNTEYGLRINTKDCLFCSNEIKYTVSTTVSAEKAFFFSYDVCKICFDNIHSNDISALNYFVKNYTSGGFISLTNISTDELLADTKKFLKEELDCMIMKCNKKDTITAIRNKSNIKIIFRITSPLDYGYMFFDETGEQFARIDSADDHPELEFGPDHLHNSSIKKDFNKKVKESFTLGLPSIDKKAIINLLNENER